MQYDREQIGKTIREERKKKKWTQKRLGKELNISGKQISKYENGKLLPQQETLLKMAELFNCEYGYLLGEETYKEGSKLDTAICQSLGLSGKAVDCLRKAIHRGLPQELGERQECISRFFESPYLGSFFDSLVDAIAVRTRLSACADSAYQELVDRYGEQIVNKAFLLNVLGGEPSARDMEDAELQEAKKAIDVVFDKHRNNDYSLKVARYELREEFELLTRSLT